MASKYFLCFPCCTSLSQPKDVAQILSNEKRLKYGAISTDSLISPIFCTNISTLSLKIGKNDCKTLKLNDPFNNFLCDFHRDPK